MDEHQDLPALIMKLVTTWHLNVLERDALPGGTAPASAIYSAVEEVLREHRWFPSEWQPEQSFDGGLIELRDNGRCRILWKTEVGLLRFEQVEEQKFCSAREAAVAYARRFFNRGIDGVPIEWNT